MTKPRLPLTDRRFVYVPSNKTNLRETFARIRAEQEEAEKREKTHEKILRFKK